MDGTSMPSFIHKQCKQVKSETVKTTLCAWFVQKGREGTDLEPAWMYWASRPSAAILPAFLSAAARPFLRRACTTPQPLQHPPPLSSWITYALLSPIDLKAALLFTTLTPMKHHAAQPCRQWCGGGLLMGREGEGKVEGEEWGGDPGGQKGGQACYMVGTRATRARQGGVLCASCS